MSNVLPFAKAAKASPNQGASGRSDEMLTELLALNEGMIAQLRLESQEVAGTTVFITGLIGDHEKAAGRLKAQLRSFESANGKNGSHGSPSPSSGSPSFTNLQHTTNS